jgi:hypothetical protein
MYRKFAILALAGMLPALSWLAASRAAAQQAAVADWQDPSKAIAFRLAPEIGLSIASEDFSATEI